MNSSGLPDWLERLLRRQRQRPMPPKLLDGYARQVMARLDVTPAGGQPRPWGWWYSLVVPVTAAAVGLLVWQQAVSRAVPSARQVLVRAMVLDDLGEAEPIVLDIFNDDDLVETAYDVDRFVLAEAPPAAVAPSVESLMYLLEALDEELPVDEEMDEADDRLEDDDAARDPAGTSSDRQVYLG